MSRQVEPGWPQRPAVGQNIWVLCASVCVSVNCNALKPCYSLSIYPHPTYQLIYIPFAFVSGCIVSVFIRSCVSSEDAGCRLV